MCIIKLFEGIIRLFEGIIALFEGIIKLFKWSLDSMSSTYYTNASPSGHDKFLVYDKLREKKKIILGSQMT